MGLELRHHDDDDDDDNDDDDPRAYLPTYIQVLLGTGLVSEREVRR